MLRAAREFPPTTVVSRPGATVVPFPAAQVRKRRRVQGPRIMLTWIESGNPAVTSRNLLMMQRAIDQMLAEDRSGGGTADSRHAALRLLNQQMRDCC